MSALRVPAVNRSDQALVVNYGSLLTAYNADGKSAIDDYYSHTRALMNTTLGGAPNPGSDLLQALLLGVVSATEFYFRDVLGRVIEVCPIARQSASGRTVTLGAVEYERQAVTGFALLEGTSLSDHQAILKATRSLTGLEIRSGSATDLALREFDRACQLRHASTHTRGRLCHHNIKGLEIPVSAPQCVKLDVLGFQQLVAVCHNAVRAYNSYAFEHVVKRWVDAGVIVGLWKSDRKRWSDLYSVFYSEEDGLGKRVAYQAWRQVAGNARASAAAQGLI